MWDYIIFFNITPTVKGDLGLREKNKTALTTRKKRKGGEPKGNKKGNICKINEMPRCILRTTKDQERIRTKRWERTELSVMNSWHDWFFKFNRQKMPPFSIISLRSSCSRKNGKRKCSSSSGIIRVALSMTEHLFGLRPSTNINTEE